MNLQFGQAKMEVESGCFYNGDEDRTGAIVVEPRDALAGTMTSNDPQNSQLLDVSSITILIDRARNGCNESRSKVLAKLQPFLVNMAGRHADNRLRTKESVSDIVQRSFLKVIENFDSFKGSSSAEFRGWLKTLVINEVRQIQRKWHRNRRDVQKECSLENHNRDVTDKALGERPVADMILQEQIEDLKNHVGKLSEIQQEVIRLRVQEGLTFPEIAERIDRSTNAVSKIWYRALIQLQKLIGN